ncbi:hypothetical protein ABES03_08740 [Neobacillus rhizosphaerae]|uniref:hypothetical protein n=1 Tax=Neobacillus rhizosphaerae TaxID=2880965 RepID=UPI003D26C1C8
MVKVEFCNALTRETFREVEYPNSEMPDSILAAFGQSDGQESFIIDRDFRTLKANYVTHDIAKEDGNTIYRMFFTVRLNDIQARVKRKK